MGKERKGAGTELAGGLDVVAEGIAVGVAVGAEIERLLLATSGLARLLATSGLARAVSAANAAAPAVPAAPMGVTC